MVERDRNRERERKMEGPGGKRPFSVKLLFMAWSNQNNFSPVMFANLKQKGSKCY